ncbi:MAG: c-type cytochrome [Casimicrobiaceae bacterium]
MDVFCLQLGDRVWQITRVAAIAALIGFSDVGVSAQPAAPAATTDNPSIKLIAATCQSCHGFEGRAQGVGLRLAGQGAAEIERKLLTFRNGTAQATIMQRHAKGYSEAELRALAQYFGRFN